MKEAFLSIGNMQNLEDVSSQNLFILAQKGWAEWQVIRALP